MSKLPTLLVPGSLSVNGIQLSDEIPVKYIINWLKLRMPEYGSIKFDVNNRILIVRAKTGSGKSTILPVEIFRILRDSSTAVAKQYVGPSVICTQPKIITAMSLAYDVSSRPWNPDMVLSRTVGYHTGPFSERSRSGLLYATSGILMTQLRHHSDAEIMERYRFILIDEAHERSTDSDMVLMMLRNFYARNIGNKMLPFLILTSATYNPILYSEYFGIGPDNIIEITGRAQPIEVRWPKTGVNDFPIAAAETAIMIHEENMSDLPYQADVLIFLPGISEITRAADRLNESLGRFTTNPYMVIIIDSVSISSQGPAFKQVMMPPDQIPWIRGHRPVRRIILSTNVAETGLTIDTLKYVIDSGWTKSMETYPLSGATGLIARPIQKNNAIQRFGRCGRLFPGIVYPLYLESTFNGLSQRQVPHIITEGIHSIFIAIVSEQHRQKIRSSQHPDFRTEHISMIDSPPAESFIMSNSIATELGFMSLDAPLPTTWPPVEFELAICERPDISPQMRGCGLTALGQLASKFNKLTMEGIRVLFSGHVHMASMSDLITAVSMFTYTTKSLFMRESPSGGLPIHAAALRESLPLFVVDKHAKVGGSAALPPTEYEEFYYRSKLLIADDFIESILIVTKFMNMVNQCAGDLRKLSEWCRSVQLNMAQLFAISAIRATVIADLIAAGMNPYHNAEYQISDSTEKTFSTRILCIKKCLYSGLRTHLLTLDAELGLYRTQQNELVKTDPLFSDALRARLNAIDVTIDGENAKPKWIMTDRLSLELVGRDRRGQQPIMYSINASMVSVLDGFIQPDSTFNAPRRFQDNMYVPVAPRTQNSHYRQLTSYNMVLGAINSVHNIRSPCDQLTQVQRGRLLV
jgi:HrpA-like RNA helicase